MKINRITKSVVDIMFALGILCVAGLPFAAKFINRFYGYEKNVLLIFMLMLFVSGVCAVYILFNLMQMLETLVGGDPFVMKNALCLKRMAVACAMIALIYAVKCFVMFSFATVAVVMVFAVGGLFCVTLKNVFEQATEYKNENDLTI